MSHDFFHFLSPYPTDDTNEIWLTFPQQYLILTGKARRRTTTYRKKSPNPKDKRNVLVPAFPVYPETVSHFTNSEVTVQFLYFKSLITLIYSSSAFVTSKIDQQVFRHLQSILTKNEKLNKQFSYLHFLHNRKPSASLPIRK